MKEYLGIKYKDKGRDKEGLDCYGLVILFYKEELNKKLPDFHYKTSKNKNIRNATILNNKHRFRPIKRHDVDKGTIIVFNIFGKASHVGVMINNSEFIHIIENQDVTVENINSVAWKNRAEGFYEY